MKQTRLCSLDDIENGGSTGLITEINGLRTSLIVVRQGDLAFVYLNTCPHTGAPLDFEAGQFMNFDRAFIMFAMHGALFNIHDGFCIQGPCVGKSLTPVVSEVREGQVWLMV
jgi:nitrite reductase/ring-hydroxylating ferredoxin subunit